MAEYDSDHCACKIAIAALDKRIDQRFIDSEKRHEERYVNQRDYNMQHNNLQRLLADQAKEMMSTEVARREMEVIEERFGIRIGQLNERADRNRERIDKLERWPWLMAGLFTVGVVIVGLVIKLVL